MTTAQQPIHVPFDSDNADKARAILARRRPIPIHVRFHAPTVLMLVASGDITLETAIARSGNTLEDLEQALVEAVVAGEDRATAAFLAKAFVRLQAPVVESDAPVHVESAIEKTHAGDVEALRSRLLSFRKDPKDAAVVTPRGIMVAVEAAARKRPAATSVTDPRVACGRVGKAASPKDVAGIPRTGKLGASHTRIVRRAVLDHLVRNHPDVPMPCHVGQSGLLTEAFARAIVDVENVPVVLIARALGTTATALNALAKGKSPARG